MNRSFHLGSLRRATAFVLAAIFALVMASAAWADPFINLDFEQATVDPGADPMFGHLPWEDAAPGWGHSSFPGSDSLYHNFGHVGDGPLFALADSSLPSSPFQPLDGQYSLVIQAGILPEYSPIFITQTGDVPSDANSIQMLFSGPAPHVFLGGVEIPMHEILAGKWVGPVTAFANTTTELKISVNVPDGGTIDDIEFSSQIVPEPSTLCLGAVGCLSLLAFARRRRG